MKNQQSSFTFKNLSVVLNSKRQSWLILKNLNFSLVSNGAVGIFSEEKFEQIVFSKLLYSSLISRSKNNLFNGKEIIYFSDYPFYTKKYFVFAKAAIMIEDLSYYLKNSISIKEQITHFYIKEEIWKSELNSSLKSFTKRLTFLNRELNDLINFEKKIKKELADGLEKILQKEKENLYNSTFYNRKITQYQKKLEIFQKKYSSKKEELKIEREELKLQLNFLKGNRRYLLEKLKIDLEKNQKIIQKFQKENKATLKQGKNLTLNENLKILNFSELSKMALFFNNKIQFFLRSDDIELAEELKKLNLTFLETKNFEEFKNYYQKNLKTLKILKDFLEERSEYKKLHIYFNFYKNLLNINSPLHSKIFIDCNNYFRIRRLKFSNFLKNSIDDLKEYSKEREKYSKKIIHKKKIKLVKKELINLNYELFLYQNINENFNKLKKIYQLYFYKYNRETINNYFNFLYFLNKKYYSIFNKVINWKFNKKIKDIKEKLIINKEDSKKNKDFFYQKKSLFNEKLVNLKKYQKEIDDHIKGMRKTINKSTDYELIQKYAVSEKRTKEWNDKKNKLSKEKEELILAIKTLKIKYHKNNLREIIDNELKEKAELLNFKAEYLNYSPKNLSMVDHFRAVLLKILITKPEFLIINNFLFSADEKEEEEIIAIYDQIIKKLGINLIILDNNLSPFKTFVDEIYFLKNGYFLEYGNTIKLLNSPIHPYIKKLMKIIKSKEPFVEDEKYLIDDLQVWQENIMNEYKKIKYHSISEDHFVLGTENDLKKWNN